MGCQQEFGGNRLVRSGAGGNSQLSTLVCEEGSSNCLLCQYWFMTRRFRLLWLSGVVLATSVFPCFIAHGIEPSKLAIVFTEKDLPATCKLPVSVPNNLTAKEYFDLASEYAEWQLPIQAGNA